MNILDNKSNSQKADFYFELAAKNFLEGSPQFRNYTAIFLEIADFYFHESKNEKIKKVV